MTNAQVRRRPFEAWTSVCSDQSGAWWKENIACFDRGDYGNKLQWFVARAFDAMHFAFFCYDDIARRDLDGVAVFVDLIFALAREDRPCILTFRMRMGSNGLTRCNMPGNDD